MNIEIVAVDKLREAYIRAGCEMYVKRLRPMMPIKVSEVRSSSAADGVTVEGKAILRRVGAGDVLWALDLHGTMVSSIGLAGKLSQVERSGLRRLVLVVGGARGLAREVIARADFVWSLSNLTFLHEMTRLILLEQIYRAVKIRRGEPYHV